MIEVVITAFVVGIAFNASPGPITAQTLSLGLRGGFWPGFHVQIGSLVGDAVWAAAALFGMAWLMQIDYFVVPLLIAGGIYMMLLAVGSVRDAMCDDTLIDYLPRRGTPMMSGALISLTNPLNITYWMSIAASVRALTESGGYLTFFLSFMAASFIWAFIMAYIAAVAGRGLPQRAVRLLFAICAAAMVYLGGLSIVTAIKIYAA